jgi:hypothetical protein
VTGPIVGSRSAKLCAALWAMGGCCNASSPVTRFNNVGYELPRVMV